MINYSFIVKDYADFKAKYYDQESRPRFRTELAMTIYLCRNAKSYINRFGAIKTKEELFNVVLLIFCSNNTPRKESELNEVIFFLDNILYRVYNDTYSTDEYKAVRIDGKPGMRLINNEGRIYGVKCGKLFTAANRVLKNPIPEKALIMFNEMFAAKWNGVNDVNKYTLHIDKRFYKIYDSEYCNGDFGSCMTNDEQYYFYENAVKASACYLTNEDNLIVARAIRFDEVYTVGEEGTIKLLERQYATDKRIDLKQILINKMIEAGEIDGYKAATASYSDYNKFISVKGEDLSGKRFYIDCNLEPGDTLSYQDSFKWYDHGTHKADNFEDGADDLSTCESTYDSKVIYYAWDGSRYIESEDTQDWIEDNCCYINGKYYDQVVKYRGNYYRFDDDDIVYSDREGEYMHIDCVIWSEREDDYLLGDDVICVDAGERKGESILYSDAVCINDIYYSDDDSDLHYIDGYWLYDGGSPEDVECEDDEVKFNYIDEHYTSEE